MSQRRLPSLGIDIFSFLSKVELRVALSSVGWVYVDRVELS